MISPENIFWHAQYRCPYCNYPTIVNSGQFKNPNFTEIFCGCGQSFKIDKPRLQFISNNSVHEEYEISSSIIQQFTSVLKSQGYNSNEIKTAIELSSNEKIDTVQDLFKKIVPKL